MINNKYIDKISATKQPWEKIEILRRNEYCKFIFI